MKAFEKGDKVHVYVSGKRTYELSTVERVTNCALWVDGVRYTRTLDPEIMRTDVAYKAGDKRSKERCDRVELCY